MVSLLVIDSKGICCIFFSRCFESFDNPYDGGLFSLIACLEACLDLEFKRGQKREAESRKYTSQLEKTEATPRRTRLGQRHLPSG